MDRWKEICKKLLFPPVWLMVLLTVVSTVLLTLVFVKGWDTSVLAYGVYVAAFYTLTVLCAFFAYAFPKQYKRIKRKIYEHPLGNQYMTDAAFRVRVSLYTSLTINLVYSAFKLASGIYYSSFWIGAIAVYYILLSFIRFMLLYSMQRKQNAGLIAEYRSYRVCAVLMVFLNLTLSGIVLNMILGEKTSSVSDVYVITNAAYTFYVLTVSIIDMIKYRKYKSPVMSAAKAIRFAQALVSLLSLEASMLMQFGEGEGYFNLMLALTGAGVCVMILSMLVSMMIRANREIENLRSQRATGDR